MSTHVLIFFRGGTNFTITGQDLATVQNPILLIYLSTQQNQETSLRATFDYNNPIRSMVCIHVHVYSVNFIIDVILLVIIIVVLNFIIVIVVLSIDIVSIIVIVVLSIDIISIIVIVVLSIDIVSIIVIVVLSIDIISIIIIIATFFYYRVVLLFEIPVCCVLHQVLKN